MSVCHIPYSRWDEDRMLILSSPLIQVRQLLFVAGDIDVHLTFVNHSREYRYVQECFLVLNVASS